MIKTLPTHAPEEARGIKAFMAHFLGLRGCEGHYGELCKPLQSLHSPPFPLTMEPLYISHSESELWKPARPRKKRGGILRACVSPCTLDAVLGDRSNELQRKQALLTSLGVYTSSCILGACIRSASWLTSDSKIKPLFHLTAHRDI